MLAARESDVRRSVWHMTSSHVKASLQPRVDQLRRSCLIKGWARHRVIVFKVETGMWVLGDYPRPCPLRSFDDEKHERKSHFI